MSVHQELRDRTVQNAKLRQFFAKHPNVIHTQETLAEACGAHVSSVRTRIGELKRGDGCEAMNLQGHSGSWIDAAGVKHRGMKRWEFVTRIGRNPSRPSPERWAIPGAPYASRPFKLEIMEAKS